MSAATMTNGHADPMLSMSIAENRVASYVASDVLVGINNLRFAVQSRQGQVDILKGVTAHIKSGEVLAILGGSGAGKTTLLDSLVLATHKGERAGSVTINGRPLDARLFRSTCAYVAQEDVQNPALTVRETMEFAAALYLGREPAQRRQERVLWLLEHAGLLSCQHIPIGGDMIKGISGGQRRRLSVTVELLKRPAVLVLDEPTSGVDSAAAEAIVDLLTKVATSNNLAVICTIHQPSSYVYQRFGQLLLLAKGCVCYCGPASAALSYFERIGFPSQTGVNPAEFLLRITNPDFCAEKQVTEICEAWKVQNYSSDMPLQEMPEPPPGAGAAIYWQIVCLLKRTVKGNIRNPTAFLGRILMSTLHVVFSCVAFSGARTRSQEQILDRIWACMWIQQMPAFLCVAAVSSFSRESLCFRKEVKNGLYHPLSYFLADSFVNASFWFVLALCSVVPGFLILDLNWDNLSSIALLTAVFIGYSDTFAQLCGTAIRSNTVAVMAFIGQAIANMIFNGMVLAQVDSVTWALRWMFYVAPAKYSFRSAIHLEFEGLTFSGYDRCLDPRLTPEERTTMICWGEKGRDVLKALSMTQFPVLTTEDTLFSDIGLIVFELAVLKVMHVGFLIMRTK